MSTYHVSEMSCRRFLGRAVVGLGTASVAGLTVGACDASAARRTTRGRYVVDSVLAAFETHRLVGLGEAHGLQNHHDVLEMLLDDPRIPEVVDDIVIEFANSLYQPTIDHFIAGQPVNNVDLRPVWRNTTQSPGGTWDQPVYEQFFRTVRAVNWTLAADKEIRVLAGDPPIDWSKITNRRELQAFQLRRDPHASSVIRRRVLDRGHRALVCYGADHLLHSSGINIASILEQHAGERIYTIADLTYAAGDPGGLAKKLAPYDRNTMIPTAGTWLGSFNAALIYGGCGKPLGSLIDAGLYLGQPETLTLSWWNPAIYLDPVYWKELQRRHAIINDFVDLSSYRKEQPARVPLMKIPPSQACGKT